jgi:hypothetical protein
MTPEQKLMHLVLLKHERLDADYYVPEDVCADNIARYYEEADAADDGYALQDARNEVRCGDVETNITAPRSRHYESKSVAAKYVDGSWVGWTYWYGGGKHGEPEAVEWMDSAYDLACVEEQVMTTKRTFTAIPQPA